MAKATASPEQPQSSGPTRRSMRTKSQPTQEEPTIGTPTQPVARGRRPQTRNASAKKGAIAAGAAKKSASKHHPRLVVAEDEYEMSDIEEDEVEELDDATRTQEDLEKIRAQMAELIRRARSVPQGLTAIEAAVREVIPQKQQEETRHVDLVSRDQSEYPPEHEEEEQEPVLHFKKFPKQRKRPVPWTREEEQFLINRITKHGPKWSSFSKKYGTNRLFGRDQTALKDKARNIMRNIIDQGNEERWLRLHPKWMKVTVGAARRGVHREDQSFEMAPTERAGLEWLSDVE